MSIQGRFNVTEVTIDAHGRRSMKLERVDWEKSVTEGMTDEEFDELERQNAGLLSRGPIHLHTTRLSVDPGAVVTLTLSVDD